MSAVAAARPLASDGSGAASANAQRSFARLAWGALVYTLGVVLFGAVVRITGSGAGCGQHWPTCQGEVAHLPRSVETAIELTHRVTSGLSLILVGGVALLAFTRFPRGHEARRWAVLSCLFMIVEALVGAALVLLALVGKNDSTARAAVMAVHLANTSLLTGSMALTAWCARPGARPPARWTPRGAAWIPVLALAAMLIVSMSGAVTALGDTLYPLDAGAGVTERFDPGLAAHFLERARILHPVLAVLAATLVLYAASRAASGHGAEAARWARAVAALVVLQLIVGVLNVALSAPGWMQVVHLLVATLAWVALVLMAAGVLASDDGTARAATG